LAVFDESARAVEAAVAMQEAAIASAHEESPLAFSIGIDYGEVLLIADADCFGDAVNLAYKLGEDIAQAGEVLISKAVRERLGAAPPSPLSEVRLSVSGLDLVAYRVSHERGDSSILPAPGSVT
jgi:class 3 adenylate cyclase